LFDKEGTMGDFRITIEGVGNHGCARDVGNGPVYGRCMRDDCVDCQVSLFVEQFRGSNISVARLEHWPVPGAAGTGRTENPGPIDTIRPAGEHGAVVRLGDFRKKPYIDVLASETPAP